MVAFVPFALTMVFALNVFSVFAVPFVHTHVSGENIARIRVVVVGFVSSHVEDTGQQLFDAGNTLPKACQGSLHAIETRFKYLERIIDIVKSCEHGTLRTVYLINQITRLREDFSGILVRGFDCDRIHVIIVRVDLINDNFHGRQWVWLCCWLF